MKLRTLPLALAAVTAVLVPLLGWGPAYADLPAAPTVENVSKAVPGHISGDAQTAEPFVFVGLQADHSDAVPIATDAGTAHFDLPTWGYSAVTVHAWACPAAVLDSTCSDAAMVDAGPATDATLAVGDPLWFTDDTVGPEGSASVTITDADGGGDLVATWAPDGGSPVDTVLSRGVATPLNVTDGDGTVTIKRCSHSTPTQCVPLNPATSKALHVQTAPLGVVVAAITDITTAHPASTFVVTADQVGDYSMSYHLESTVVPGATVPGTTPAAPAVGTLTGSGATAATSVLAPASVPDGTYKLVGTITVTGSTYGPYTGVAFSSAAFTIHRQGPALDSITASATTIYPLVDNISAYPSTTKFTITGADAPDVTAAKLYRNSSGAFVRNLKVTHVDATHATVGWSGLLADASPAPAGLSKLKVADRSGNVSTTVGSVTVSGQKLVLKTWTHTYTPAGTLADKYVGRCSTLRQPSRRDWYFSLGYYANTRCTSQTSKDSLVSTLHAVFLPKAYQYLDIRVTPYGGSAAAKPGSKAVVRYLTTARKWTAEKTMSSTMGYHPGYTRSTTGLVFKDHSFGWGLYTGFGYQYDVKSFTVVLHYKALG